MALIDLVKDKNNKRWNWSYLSSNRCISMQDIIDNINLNWDWMEVCARDDIDVKNVTHIINQKKLPPSAIFQLCANRSLGLDDLLHIGKFIKLNWYGISRHRNITINDILSYQDAPWDWTKLSEKIPISDIIKNKHLPWKVIMIEKKSDIHYIKEHPDLQWEVIINLCTLQFIMSNFDLPWNWGKVYRYHYLTDSFEKLSTIPELDPPNDLKWKMYSSYHPITSGFIRANMNKAWDYKALSSNKSLTLDIIKRYPNKPWDYDAISKNKGDLGKGKMKIIKILSKYKICFDLAEIIYEYSEKVHTYNMADHYSSKS